MSELTNRSIEDHGVTYREGDYSERTLTVSGWVVAVKREMYAAILLDSAGRFIANEQPFQYIGIDNYELACRLVAEGHDFPDSLCGLLETEIEEAAQEWARG